MPARTRTKSSPTTTKPSRDHSFAQALERWFASSARDLPWRTPLTVEKANTRANIDHAPRRDPYRSLVSEAMLQQTQVSRVLDYFARFLERFPTVEALAEADEQAVLAAWAGLGYYRRAKQLHAAARAIVADHAGTVPADPEALRALPGVGRYTAGAIASIVFGQRTPLVDGNVARVLLRLEGKPMTLGEPATDRWAWQRAEQLVSACDDPGVFNEALMELGALICTPKQPACDACPLRANCQAKAQGTQADIPSPKKRATKHELFAEVLLARARGGGFVIEQRPAKGLWSSMWQLPTHEHAGPGFDAAAASAHFNLGPLEPGDPFLHQTTHRTLRFQPWRTTRAIPRKAFQPGWVHINAETLGSYAMSNPQRRLAKLLIDGA